MSGPKTTLVHLFLDRIEQSATETAVIFDRNGQQQLRSWSQLAQDVFSAVGGLVDLGIETGDRVVHLSENRYEWIVTDLAIQLSHAIHVPVHAPLAAEQVEYQVLHSGAKAVILSGAEQLGKLQRVASRLPSNLPLVMFDAEAVTEGSNPATDFSSWIQDPQTATRGQSVSETTRDSITGESLGTILYTSGTTGEPKGVMLTQANLVSNAQGTVKAFGMSPDDIRLNFLPLSHIFARTCDLYTWLCNGSQLCLATSRESVLPDCQWAKPTLISGVPYFFDRVRRYLVEQGMAEQVGALRQLLGGEIKYCCSGGAALPNHVFDFFEQQKVPLLQGYGLTETSPVISLSSPNSCRRGASGQAIEHVDITTADDGEIITRGPHVMQGYWRNSEATQEVIVDGWFHTGDLGKVDEDGFVWITGRKKELIVTAAGKNVAPVLLESLLTEDPWIEQALVVGDGRSFLTALIVPDWAAIESAFATPKSAAAQQASVVAAVQSRVDERLACVSYHEQVRKLSLLVEPFSIERHEMTPKLSLRRPIIEAHYADLIEAMYKKK